MSIYFQQFFLIYSLQYDNNRIQNYNEREQKEWLFSRFTSIMQQLCSFTQENEKKNNTNNNKNFFMCRMQIKKMWLNELLLVRII